MRKIYRARAPLRLGLGGGGSDLPIFSDKFGGCVLNVTIDKYVHVTLSPRRDQTITITSEDFNVSIQYPNGQKLPYDGNLDLVKAAINRIREFHYQDIGGFDLLIRADMPPGAGLGTSSTVVVALIGVLNEWLGLELDDLEIADLAYNIERVDMALAGGKQDQYAAACGGFNFMEFQKNGKVIVNTLRIKPGIRNELQENILLCYTGMIHRSEDMIQEQEPNDEHKICLMEHIKNMAYTMKDCILCGDLETFGELLSSEWDYKKQLSKNISNSKLLAMEQAALAGGASGVKLTGAGGGGLFIIYTDWTKRKNVMEVMKLAGGQIIDYSFIDNGLETWGVNHSDVKVK